MKEAPKEHEFVKESRDTSFKCVDAVEISLFIEKEGLAFYEKAAKNALDSRVKDMFLRLAEEEREHIQTLQTKIQFLKRAISGKGTGDLLDQVLVGLPPISQETSLKDGLRVAVIGKPNVGKSSFINRLLGEERSLVSDQAGTPETQ